MMPNMVEIKKAVIDLSSDGERRRVKEVYDKLVTFFGLTENEVMARNESDTDYTFNHRLRAAKQQLVNEGKLEKIDRYIVLRP